MVFVCGVALVTLLAIFGWLVFGRYVLNQTPTWVEQLALLLVVLITFLMTAVGVREGWHLGVTGFVALMPPGARAVIRILSDLALAVFGAVMMAQSWKLVQFGWSTNLPMLNIPEGIRTIPVVICGALMFLFAGLRAWQGILSLFTAGKTD